MKYQRCTHIETSQLICFANQFTGLYIKATLAFNGLSNGRREYLKMTELKLSTTRNFQTDLALTFYSVFSQKRKTFYVPVLYFFLLCCIIHVYII